MATAPHNTEAEQALLGAILIDNAAYHRVSGFLRPDHFASGVHGRLYSAISTLLDRGDVATPVVLKNQFDQILREVGGAQYLVQLIDNAVTIINAEHYARTIVDLHLRRELILIADEMIAAAYREDLGDSPQDQVQRAEDALLELSGSAKSETEDLSIGAAVRASMAATEATYRRGGGLAGLSTGLVDLDRALGGLAPTDLIIVAGRPSMGKTSLGMGIAEAVAAAETAVGVCQLEQSSVQLAQRLLAKHSNVDAQRQRRGDLDALHWQALIDAAANFNNLPIWIDDSAGMTLGQIRHRARSWHRRHGIGLLIVDHLQLVTSVGKENRSQEIGEYTRGLKALAKQLGIPVLLLSQLSRAVEQRDNKRPQLADLRESGAIEQDADVVIFVYREEYYLNQTEPTQKEQEPIEKFNDRHDRWRAALDRAYGRGELIIAKQRNGPLSTVPVTWLADRTEFANYAGAERLT